MNGDEASDLALRISRYSGISAVAVRVRWVRKDGRNKLVRIPRGESHDREFWAVIQFPGGRVLFPIEYRNAAVENEPLAQVLRETERVIADRLRRQDPRTTAGGLTPERWEEVRQWPGEFSGNIGDGRSDAKEVDPT
jgi:hypothetical protein